MAELVVTVNDYQLLPALKQAISLLQGVTQVKELTKKMKSKYDIQTSSETLLSDVPESIRHLIGIASELNEKEIDNDDRLSYLLNK